MSNYQKLTEIDKPDPFTFIFATPTESFPFTVESFSVSAISLVERKRLSDNRDMLPSGVDKTELVHSRYSVSANRSKWNNQDLDNLTTSINTAINLKFLQDLTVNMELVILRLTPSHSFTQMDYLLQEKPTVVWQYFQDIFNQGSAKVMNFQPFVKNKLFCGEYYTYQFELIPNLEL